jgi:hypothetical protein
VKAELAALHISISQPEIKDKLVALATFGQPVWANTKFGDYSAQAIDPEKIIRIVSSNDIAPFNGIGAGRQHSALVDEVFLPDEFAPEFTICETGETCSASETCETKTWSPHSMYEFVF